MSAPTSVPVSTCDIPEEKLWSVLDRGGTELDDHIAACPTCQARAEALRAEIASLTGAAATPARPMPIQVGPYRIRGVLGEGGMGIVYEGEQPSPHRRVAVKVVRGGEHVGEFRVQLFRREAQVLARLRHPGIAAIYEAGLTEDGQHYFAMELVRGVPLTSYARERAMPIRDRLELFRRVCEAINYAHQRGVIHRDLKPSNILVEENGEPRILDFGLARLTDTDGSYASTLTTAGNILGTVPYMSPEVAQGRSDEVDIRSDVYSLGVMLYELLTDEHPFKVARLGLHEAVRVISEEAPRKPSHVRRQLRGDLDTIILKCLEKEPSRRYPNAQALAEDIDRHLRSQPVLARPPSALYAVGKFVDRHRSATLLTLALTIVLITSAAWIMRLITRVDETNRGKLEIQQLLDAVTMNKRGITLRDQGALDTADVLLRESLTRLRALRGDENDYTAGAMVDLAVLLVMRNTEDADIEAEEVLLDGLAIYEAIAPLNPKPRITILEHLRVLYGPDRLDDADDLQWVEGQLAELNAGIAAASRAPSGP